MKIGKIRKAQVLESSLISELIQRTVRLTNSADYTRQEIEFTCLEFTPEKVAEKMEERDVFVFVQDDRILGTVSLEGDKLHALFVDPECQSGGVGSDLVHHVEQLAQHRGIQELTLSSSITAAPFYTSLGYDQLHIEERKIGSTYLMKKALN